MSADGIINQKIYLMFERAQTYTHNWLFLYEATTSRGLGIEKGWTLTDYPIPSWMQNGFFHFYKFSSLFFNFYDQSMIAT